MHKFNGKTIDFISNKELLLNSKFFTNTYFRALSKVECDKLKNSLKEFLRVKKFNNENEINRLNNLLKKEYGIEYQNIIGIGDTNMDVRFCQSVVQSHFYSFSGDTAWKCFCIPNWEEARYGITHVDAKSAWNCAMLSIGNPEFGIIYTKNRV